VTLTSVSNDERRAIFLVSSSDDPGTYFLFDSEKNTFEELAKLMPWLERPKLGRAKPITLKARDGLELHGYLTLPAAGPQRGLPLVLMPHGGPRGRDFGTFDPLVQLMASRGYGVLQVNFRGSVGYGLAFDKAGWREWGGKMQDDLTDAVRWSVSQGIADPSRICVFGASYGGYAAMMGLAATPELFRCGVDYVGVTDINLLLRTIPRAWETARAELNLQIGDPKADKDLLAARSPVNLAQNIRVPVLMAYGKRDPRVVFQHATRFEDALQRAKVPYELIVKTNEGHGYAKFENQVEFGTRLVEFLGKYIGPATAAAPAATTGGR
jgi:dipeptidyl aminopeptidase/acylaminoacyl peptidase